MWYIQDVVGGSRTDVSSVHGCAAVGGRIFMASPMQAFFLSSILTQKLSLNLGFKKQHISIICFVFSEYLASKSPLIACFIALVSAESAPSMRRISPMMCSIIGFTADMVTLFSEARASSKSLRGERSCLSFSKVVTWCSFGIRAHELQSSAKTLLIGCCCSRNQDTILKVESHLVTTSCMRSWFGSSRSFCFFLSARFFFQLREKASTRCLHAFTASWTFCMPKAFEMA